MWFQAPECNAVNASLLLNLINNNFLIFQPRIFPFCIPTYPQNPKIRDPILVNLLKMRPHYGHSSRENATPSSGTSLLATTGFPLKPVGGVAKCQLFSLDRKIILIVNWTIE